MDRAAFSSATFSVFSGADAVDLITGLAWPLLIGLVVWRLLPSIREILRSRGFTVTAGGMEISVQQASDQLASRLDDVREQVSALQAGPEGGERTIDGARQLRSVLWVDDFPQNNAFEVEALQNRGVEVRQATTTADALNLLDAHPGIQVVISDMGRAEDGPDAGTELVRAVKERWPDTPVVIYASAPAVARRGPDAIAAGAAGATASATELTGMLSRIGGRCRVAVRRTGSGALVRAVESTHRATGRRPYAVFADSSRVVVVDDGVRQVDVADGAVRSLGPGNAPADPRGLTPPAAVHGERRVTTLGGQVPRLWNLRDLRAQQELRESNRAVSAVAFSPDGSVLATAGPDGVRLWDVALAQLLTTLTAAPSDSVAFSDDGRRVVASGRQVGAQVFPCRPCGSTATLIEAARRLASADHPLAPVTAQRSPGRDRAFAHRPRVNAQPEPSQTTSPGSPTPAPAPHDSTTTTTRPPAPATPTPTATAQPQPEPVVTPERLPQKFRTKGRWSGATVQG